MNFQTQINKPPAVIFNFFFQSVDNAGDLNSTHYGPHRLSRLGHEFTGYFFQLKWYEMD